LHPPAALLSLIAHFAALHILPGASFAAACLVFPPNAIDSWFLPLYNAIMATKLTLDKVGRVVLPKPLRDRLQLAPGDTLHLESEGERITLRPVRQNVMLKKELGVWVYQGEATDTSIADLVDRERENRNRSVTESDTE
jgi:AbrB family looped-hinge helix DNA binding protein